MDSSVWIDFFNSRRGQAGWALERLIAANQPIAITGLVITEVLQGVWRDLTAVIGQLTEFPWLEDAGFATFADAAALVRAARQRGLTIGTVDAILATLALAHDAELFTLDRDLYRLGFTGLRLHAFTSGKG